jgi:hypothetical protein
MKEKTMFDDQEHPTFETAAVDVDGRVLSTQDFESLFDPDEMASKMDVAFDENGRIIDMTSRPGVSLRKRRAWYC